MQTGDQQLALPFTPDPPVGDLVADPSNAAARRWLGNMADWPNRRLAIWGPPGSGKSSLVRMWLGPQGLLLAGPDLHDLRLHSANRLAVDDADRCTEAATLLHLLNAAAETGSHVVLTGQSAPAHWGVDLPDLASRLKATLAVEIEPPDDGLLALLLARVLAERQLQVPQPVQEWLLRRLPRTFRAIDEAAARLDSVSLARQHPITRALAAAALHDMLAATDENTMTDDAC